MKAFAIYHASATADGTDIGPDYFLPDVRCDSCGEEWGAPEFWYPTVDPPWVRDWRHVERGAHEVVTWKQFVSLRKALRRIDPQVAAVTPGSAVGPPSGRVSRPLPSFFCDGELLIVEARLAEFLRSEGVAMRATPVRIRRRRRYLADFVAIEPLVVNALAPMQRKKLVVRECATCGFQEENRQFRNQTGSVFLRLRKDVLRDHPHVFVVRETGKLVFTEAFLHIIQGEDVGELDTQHCGDFV